MNSQPETAQRPSFEVAPITLPTFFLLWPWTFTYDLDPGTWPTSVRTSCQISGSHVIYLERYCPRTQTDTHSGPIALPEVKKKKDRRPFIPVRFTYADGQIAKQW